MPTSYGLLNLLQQLSPVVTSTMSALGSFLPHWIPGRLPQEVNVSTDITPVSITPETKLSELMPMPRTQPPRVTNPIQNPGQTPKYPLTLRTSAFDHQEATERALIQARIQLKKDPAYSLLSPAVQSLVDNTTPLLDALFLTTPVCASGRIQWTFEKNAYLVSSHAEECPLQYFYFDLSASLQDPSTRSAVSYPLGFTWVQRAAKGDEHAQILIAPFNWPTQTKMEFSADRMKREILRTLQRLLQPLEVTQVLITPLLHKEEANRLLYSLLQPANAPSPSQPNLNRLMQEATKANIGDWLRRAVLEGEQQEAQGAILGLSRFPLVKKTSIEKTSVDTKTPEFKCPWLKRMYNEQAAEQCARFDWEKEYDFLNTLSIPITEALLKEAALACLAGEISIAVDESQRKVGLRTEEFYSCQGPLLAYHVTLHIGPFDFTKDLSQQGDIKRESKTHEGHANLLLLDSRTKTGEYFEPNYPDAWYVEPTRRLLFQRVAKVGYQAIDSPLLFCPRLNIQVVAAEGLCLLVVLLYLLARINCPFMSKEEIVNRLTSLGRENLLQLLFNFLCYVTTLGHRIEDEHLRKQFRLAQLQMASDLVSGLQQTRARG